MDQEIFISGEEILNLPNEPYIHLIYNRIRDNPDKPFLIDGTTGHVYLYRDLFEKTLSIAQALKNYGIITGDVISIVTDNDLDGIAVLVACWFVGGVGNPLNADFSKDDIKKMLTISKPSLIYCGRSLELVQSALKEMKKDIPILHSSAKDPRLNLTEILKINVSGFHVDIKDSDTHVPTMLFTSGTTGTPKGIKLRDRALHVMSKCCVMGKTSTKFLLTSPMFWISNIIIISTCLADVKTLIVSKMGAPIEELLRVIEVYKPEAWFTGPHILLQLCQLENVHKYNFTTLSSIVSGGSLLLAEQKRLINKTVFKNEVIVKHIYGSTEVGMITTWADNMDLDSNEYNSVGAIAEGVKLKVIDPVTGKSLGPRQEGEICVKTETMMRGIVREDSFEIFENDSWFRMGDIGYYDEKKLIYIVGRNKDVFKYKNIQITPAEIESIINDHDDIIDSCVVGRPDSTNGELPTAFIILKNSSQLTEKDLYDYVANRVADHKKLRGGIYFVHGLPRSTVGKIVRKNVEKLLETYK